MTNNCFFFALFLHRLLSFHGDPLLHPGVTVIPLAPLLCVYRTAPRVRQLVEQGAIHALCQMIDRADAKVSVRSFTMVH